MSFAAPLWALKQSQLDCADGSSAAAGRISGE